MGPSVQWSSSERREALCAWVGVLVGLLPAGLGLSTAAEPLPRPSPSTAMLSEGGRLAGGGVLGAVAAHEVALGVAVGGAVSSSGGALELGAWATAATCPLAAAGAK